MPEPYRKTLALVTVVGLSITCSQAVIARQDGETAYPASLLTVSLEEDNDASPADRGRRDIRRNRSRNDKSGGTRPGNFGSGHRPPHDKDEAGRTRPGNDGRHRRGPDTQSGSRGPGDIKDNQVGHHGNSRLSHGARASQRPSPGEGRATDRHKGPAFSGHDRKGPPSRGPHKSGGLRKPQPGSPGAGRATDRHKGPAFSGHDRKRPSSHEPRMSGGLRKPQHGVPGAGRGRDGHMGQRFSSRDLKRPTLHRPNMSRGPQNGGRTANRVAQHQKGRGFAAERGSRSDQSRGQSKHRRR